MHALKKVLKKKVRSCMSKKFKNDKYRQKPNFSKQQMIKKRKKAVSKNRSETSLNKQKRGTEDNQNDYSAQSEMKRKKIKKTSKNQNNQCMPNTSHKEGANREASEVENFQSSDEDITIPLKKNPSFNKSTAFLARYLTVIMIKAITSLMAKATETRFNSIVW